MKKLNQKPFLPNKTVTLIALSAAFTTPALAQTAAEKGLQIAQQIESRDNGFIDSRVTLKMTLTNRNGETSTRELRLASLETSDKTLGDKSLTVFDRPRDIRGTAFLSFTKILDPDDQWLFLPALKRVKRISSANKSGPFVGSEFAYEDLVSFEVGKYDFKWLRDEPCGDLQCFVVERTPRYKKSGYSRQVTWVDDQEYRIMRVDYYDRKASLLKTLQQSGFKQYLSQYWRPSTMIMKNQQTGKQTLLQFENYKFRTGVRENDFTPGRLKRIR